MAKTKINIKKKSLPKPKVMSVKGLTTSDILKMDVYKLNTPSLRAVLNRLISSANKRIRRLKQSAPHSQALLRNQEGFSLKGIKKTDRNNTEILMKKVKNFLNAESSTITGYKEQRERVELNIGQFESVEQENDFWNVYNDWINKHPNLSARFNDSFQLRSMMYDEFITKGKTAKGSKSAITKAIKKMLGETNKQSSIEDKIKRDKLKNKDVLQFDNSF